MKKTALLAAALGATALALTACGSSDNTVTPQALPEVQATATALPGETPTAAPSPSGSTPPGETVDPMQDKNAKTLTVSKGDAFDIKFEGTLPDGAGLSVITDNGVTVEASKKGVDFAKKTASFDAKRAGKVRISIGAMGADGKALGQWTVYDVTVK